jgi:hypothetical protein
MITPNANFVVSLWHFCVAVLFNWTDMPTKLKLYFGHTRYMIGRSKGCNLQPPKRDIQIYNIYENSQKKITFTTFCNPKKQQQAVKFSSWLSSLHTHTQVKHFCKSTAAYPNHNTQHIMVIIMLHIYSHLG